MAGWEEVKRGGDRCIQHRADSHCYTAETLESNYAPIKFLFKKHKSLQVVLASASGIRSINQAYDASEDAQC